MTNLESARATAFWRITERPAAGRSRTGRHTLSHDRGAGCDKLRHRALPFLDLAAALLRHKTGPENRAFGPKGALRMAVRLRLYRPADPPRGLPTAAALFLAYIAIELCIW